MLYLKGIKESLVKRKIIKKGREFVLSSELKNIINRYQEFDSFLKGINVEDFKKYSRAELNEFYMELREYSFFRSLSFEVSKIIDEKKKEEYPELLGVHHYPVIKEIDYLSEEDKINLDKYLVGLGFNHYLYKGSHAWYTLAKKWGEETQEKVLQFLVDTGILERMYRMNICHDTMILTKEKVDKYLKYFDMKKNLKELSDKDLDTYYELEENLELYYCCMDCDNEVEINETDIRDAINSNYAHVYKVIKDRDKSLDNV